MCIWVLRQPASSDSNCSRESQDVDGAPTSAGIFPDLLRHEHMYCQTCTGSLQEPCLLHQVVSVAGGQLIQLDDHVQMHFRDL